MTTKEANANGSPKLNLYQKLALISGELGAITKDAQAPQEMGGFKFMSHGALMGHLREKLAERQVAILESLRIVSDDVVMLRGRDGERANRRVVVELTAEFVNGEDPDDRYTVIWPGEGLDTRDKAMQKAGTSAEKYLLAKTFKVSDKDDPEGAETGDLAGTGRASADRPASDFTTPAQARQQPPQGRTPQPERPDTCPKCGKQGTLVVKPDGGALCVAAKDGCGAKLTKVDFAAAAAGAAAQPDAAAAAAGAQGAPSLAQQIAMACKEAGIDSQEGRNRLRLAVTGKERNADLTEEEARKVLAAARSLAAGKARLENSDGHWSLVAIERGAA